jgi:hypothetical protein
LLAGNLAWGGAGGLGGDGRGGGVYNDTKETMTFTRSLIVGNRARGGQGQGGSDGQGIGGGVYFADGGIVCLDWVTQTNLTGNTASTSDPDIFGAFKTC